LIILIDNTDIIDNTAIIDNTDNTDIIDKTDKPQFHIYYRNSHITHLQTSLKYFYWSHQILTMFNFG